jgi:hypothetical protein
LTGKSKRNQAVALRSVLSDRGSWAVKLKSPWILNGSCCGEGVMADHEDAVEVRAYRAAIQAFVETYCRVLKSEGAVVQLAETGHEHTTLMVLGEGALSVKVRVDFGTVVPVGDLQELMSKATEDPGSVPTA